MQVRHQTTHVTTEQPLVDSQEVTLPKHLIPVSLGISILAITFLFWLIYGHHGENTYEVGYLAAVNACLNAASATCLFAGFRAIRRGQWVLHRNFMLAALVFSSLFLISYVIYHFFHGDSKFAGTGAIKAVYLLILISHIFLSAVALPGILVTAGAAMSRRFSIHKKWARIIFPIWAYVSVTGVVIFLMLKIWGSLPPS